MLDTTTKQRFEDALPKGFAALKDLAQKLKSQGFTQVAVYQVFDSFRRQLAADTTRDPFHQAVIVRSQECIAGWCGESSRWFERALTKAEIDAGHETNA